MAGCTSARQVSHEFERPGQVACGFLRAEPPRRTFSGEAQIAHGLREIVPELEMKRERGGYLGRAVPVPLFEASRPHADAY